MQTALYNPYTNKTDNDHEAGVIRDGSFNWLHTGRLVTVKTRYSA